MQVNRKDREAEWQVRVTKSIHVCSWPIAPFRGAAAIWSLL